MLRAVFTNSHNAAVCQPSASLTAFPNMAKNLYFSLLNETSVEQKRAASTDFLDAQLEATESVSCDLPASISAIASWIHASHERVGHEYLTYLAGRKAGKPRRYFSNKSHALYFLKSVAPTKLVDGAWLYGLLQRWNDERFSALIKIYLEELGDGVPDKNHVVLYQKLLRTHGCEDWESVDDAYYGQGAIQLALAYQADNYLPEIIGFNLGYEQLPLHLLITAYELNELDIDPYYFTLHVTIDNATTGHAQKSLEGLLAALPRAADQDEFYQRVRRGYKLNSLGIGTEQVIHSFDLHTEMIEVLTAQSVVGKHVHSDYCRIGGRTINEWLANTDQIPEFLELLEEKNWIKRHQHPQNSRFWKLIEGERAEMFGVFSSYQKQVIYDWIMGDASASAPATDEQSNQIVMARQPLTFKARQRLLGTFTAATDRPSAGLALRGILRRHPQSHAEKKDWNDFNHDLRTLEEDLALLGSKDKIMQRLITFMSPVLHHTPAGLMATRIFNKMFT